MITLPLHLENGDTRFGHMWFLKDAVGVTIAITKSEPRITAFRELVEAVNTLSQENMDFLAAEQYEERYVV